MRISLTLADRSAFVSEADGRVDGYIVAQPGSPLHLPPAHDERRIGLIDDFVADPFGHQAAMLVDTAEKAFVARGVDTTLAICPADPAEKKAVLSSCGYRATNLWMVKPRSPR